MKVKARVCSVCLGKTNTIHLIEDVMKEVFDVLHLKLRLNAAEEHIMCTECVEIVEQLFEFKTRCLYTDDYLFPFVENGQVNLKKIYSEMVKVQTENNNNTLIGYEVCRFCLELVESGFFLSLTEVKSDVDLAEVLREYLPELKDLQTITETGICMNCEESLRKYYKFAFRFGESSVVGENNSTKIVDVCSESKTVLRVGKIKKNVSEDSSGCKLTSVPPKLYQCDKCEYQTDKRPNFNKHKFVHKDVSQVPAYKCSQCDYTTRYRRNMRSHKKLMHKDPSQLRLFSCDRCSFTTKYKHSIQIHEKVHQTERSFKCSRCSYSSKYLGGLRNHGKTHKEPIDISSSRFTTKPAHLAPKMHYCDKCDYKTNKKFRLTRHAVIHQDPSERVRFKCDRCSFFAFTETGILHHHLIHKKPSEITMYECAICSHKTDRKLSLKIHLLTHKSQEEVKMFACELCPYTSRYKSCVTRHKLMRHKISDKKARPKEKRLYQCFSCSYETTDRVSFVNHLVVHRDVPEEMMYKCDLCPYSGKRPVGLQNHMRVHKDVVECKTWDCHLCDFKTVHQTNLRRHKLIHDLKPKKKGRRPKSK